MVVGALITVIGLASSVVTLYGFTSDNLPAKAEPPKPKQGPKMYVTTVRVHAGLDGTQGMTHAGGHISEINSFNANGKPLGRGAPRDRLEDGHHLDIEVKSTVGEQPVSIQLDGTHDNVCIAYMSTTWPDGTKFGWTGDWANLCGLPSYYSGIVMPDGNKPECMWVGIKERGMKTEIPPRIRVEWANFLAPQDGSKPSMNAMLAQCGLGLRVYDQDFNEMVIPKNNGQDRGVRAHGGWAKRDSAHSVFPHLGRSDERLIVSSLSGHNATALCERPHSYGPDFVSLEENIYCNMETRETLPLCAPDSEAAAAAAAQQQQGECFDVSTASHVVRDGTHKPRIRARSPSQVIHW